MKKYIFILATIMACTTIAYTKAGQTNTTKITKLPLDTFIKNAMQNNQAIKRIKADYKNQQHTAKKTAALKDLILSAATTFAYTDPVYSGSTISSYNNKKWDLQTKLSKKFPSLLGMTASLNFNYAAYSSKSSSGTTTSDYSPSIGFSLTIPLLNNFLGRIDKNSLQGMRLSIKLLKKTEQEAIETFLLSLYYAYYDWALSSKKISIYRGFMNRAYALYGQTLRKRRIGIADYADISLTLQNYLSYKASYENAKLQAKQNWLEILSLMEGKPLSKIKKNRSEKTTATPDIIFDDKTIPLKRGIQLEDLRIMQISSLQVETAKLTAHSAGNNKKPELNFIISGSKSSGDSSLSSSFNSFNRNYIYTGLELTMPLQNTDKKQGHAAAKAALKKQTRQHKELSTSVSFSIAKLKIKINQLTQLVKLQKQVAAASAARINAMYRKYRQGRLALSQVTDARNAWANARIKYIEQSIALKRSALEYAALTDQLLKMNKNTKKVY